MTWTTYYSLTRGDYTLDLEINCTWDNDASGLWPDDYGTVQHNINVLGEQCADSDSYLVFRVGDKLLLTPNDQRDISEHATLEHRAYEEELWADKRYDG